MARSGNYSRAPHLQVGSRLTAALATVLAISLLTPQALAASKKPSPTSTVKATAKATAKATPKATTKTTPNPSAKPTATAKATTTSTSKATPKPTATKKKTIHKKRKRVKISLSPSPSVVWPPKGFSQQGEVYAKIPSSKELIGILSADSTLAQQVKDCTKYVCGAVQAAAETGCSWWEITTNIAIADGRKLGVLTTVHTGTKPKVIKGFITVSPELIETGAIGKVSAVVCHHDSRDPAMPLSDYKKTQ